MASTDQSHKRYVYTFGPRETSGIFLGLGMGSILAVFAAVFLLTRLLAEGVAGTLIGLLIVVLTFAAVWVPVADRTLGQWLPVGVIYAARRVMGYSEYRGGPAAITSRTPGEPGSSEIEPLELPGELVGLSILTATVQTVSGSRAVGIVKDRRRATYVVILSTQGSAFQLLTPEEQDQRLVSWGDTLASLASSASGIVRVQVLDTTVPDSGNRLARRWASEGGQGTEGTRDSYGQLLNSARPVTQRHENYVALMLDARKVRRQIRTLGGGDRGACAYLIQQAQAFTRELQLAGVEVEGALPPRQIAMVIRTAYEPGARWAIESRGPDMLGAGGASPDEAGPMATDARNWAYYRTDDTFHAVYWIAEWPRKPVTGSFLEQLILLTSCERAISVVMEPLDPRRAEDEVARRETSQEANDSLRRRAGFRSSARQRRESSTVTRQDEALASGQGLYRFLGLIRVSAPSLEALDRACADIEINARSLRLRRLYGEQDIAFCATLPLARGLRWGMIR